MPLTLYLTSLNEFLHEILPSSNSKYYLSVIQYGVSLKKGYNTVICMDSKLIYIYIYIYIYIDSFLC